jgi:hypothetical protein
MRSDQYGDFENACWAASPANFRLPAEGAVKMHLSQEHAARWRIKLLLGTGAKRGWNSTQCRRITTLQGMRL